MAGVSEESGSRIKFFLPMPLKAASSADFAKAYFAKSCCQRT